ncbi:MAG: cellulose synthase operon protein YhjQ [Aquipseudomonas alcaligenes]|uniref:Cellulose synthase operon protein YhjQ n=1 Tax=Aquipseudomonas alcaligenes TaxID=43263 RepID=A0A5C7VW87_AQUAC|nr:MAG: cellulose synthase operon protein YhjQ [Pseudomonas alcaligenes]
MTSLALYGVRGGLGRSSLLAALGYALSELGERVLLVDLCSDNLLRLHFNLPLDERGGWARAELEGRPFGEPLYEVLDGLCLMPFGELDEAERARLWQRLAPGSWRTRLAPLARRFDWLLFDQPAAGLAAGPEVDVPVLVVEADGACQVLLGRQALERHDLLLINRYEPASRLQRDLLLVWQRLFGERLALQLVHRDEALAEALACKAPVGHYAPHSLAARDVQSLAVRCLTRRRG